MKKQLPYRTLFVKIIIVSVSVVMIALSGCHADGGPNLSDVWVLNGLIFPDCYDTSHLNEQ